MFLLAQAIGSYSIAHIAITIVIIAAIVGLVYVALNQFGVGIPGWVMQIFWICLVCCCVIMAIRFVAGV